MKRLWHHLGGVLFDGACLVCGFAAAFLAAAADYEGTLAAQFWFFRLTLSTLPVALVAFASSFIRHERAWRCWLRFTLFEGMALWMAVGSAERVMRGDFAYGGRFLPAVLLDAAVYLGVLNLWRLRWRPVG